MGFWNDGLRAPSPQRARSRSRQRSRSQSRSPSRRKSSYASRPAYTRSVSSFFSGISPSSAPRGRSYSSRARPRDGFVAKVRKFLRDVYNYMKKHPAKVFFLVIMPLITGGALTKLLATVGVRLPRNVESMLGSSMNRGYGENERFYARGGARDYQQGGSLPGMGGGVGDSIQSALSIAKMFM